MKGRWNGDRSRGEQKPNHKVTAEQVVEIRNRHANGEYARALAREFGIGHKALRDIINRVNWKHV